MAEPARKVDTSEWLTVEQVVKRYRWSRHAVYRRIRDGRWEREWLREHRKLVVNERGLRAWIRAGGDVQHRSQKGGRHG